MKKIITFSILFASLLVFYSCKKPKPLIEIHISSVEIELNDIEINEDGIFNATQTINFSSLEGFYDEAIKYKDRIEMITVNTAHIRMIVTNFKGTGVKEFMVKEDNIGNYYIDEYALGTPHYNASLESYTEKLLSELLLNGSIDINVSGRTDAPANEELHVAFILQLVRLWVKE